MHGNRDTTPRRIYILGSGAIGRLVAHAIAGIPHRPPITLLLRSPRNIYDWKKRGEAIEITRHGIIERRTGFDVELSSIASESGFSGEQDSAQQPIRNLIVCVKAMHTVLALNSIKQRLGPESTICFLQNGMGVREEVDSAVFPDVKSRPHYIFGVVSHGVYGDSTSSFSAVHAGDGSIALGAIPKPTTEDNERLEERGLDKLRGSRYLLRTLTRTPALAAFGVNPVDLTVVQLEKLAVNAVINALTVLFDCKNGELSSSRAAVKVKRLLIAEISLVYRSLPELAGLPNVDLRFSPGKLENRITSIEQTTADNVSSTLVDVRKGRTTEVQYINGYIVRRGEELGIRCILNYMIWQMVLAKQRIKSREAQGLLPLQRPVGLQHGA